MICDRSTPRCRDEMPRAAAAATSLMRPTYAGDALRYCRASPTILFLHASGAYCGGCARGKERCRRSDRRVTFHATALAIFFALDAQHASLVRVIDVCAIYGARCRGCAEGHAEMGQGKGARYARYQQLIRATSRNIVASPRLQALLPVRQPCASSLRFTAMFSGCLLRHT